LAASLHLVDDEARVALLAVPLEAFEVRVGHLVVGLLLELLVDGI